MITITVGRIRFAVTDKNRASALGMLNAVLFGGIPTTRIHGK